MILLVGKCLAYASVNNRSFCASNKKGPSPLCNKIIMEGFLPGFYTPGYGCISNELVYTLLSLLSCLLVKSGGMIITSWYKKTCKGSERHFLKMRQIYKVWQGEQNLELNPYMVDQSSNFKVKRVTSYQDVSFSGLISKNIRTFIRFFYFQIG